MDKPLYINRRFSVPPYAVEITAVRASGPGGQHVNKTNSAVQLRCDLNSFHIPESDRRRIRTFRDGRITADDVVIIKAQTHRSQSRNLDDALRRLQSLLRKAVHVDAPRLKTRPSYSSNRRAVKAQKERREVKRLRGKVRDFD